MLVSAFVRLAFDVQINPAAIRVAISRSVAAHSFGRGPCALVRNLVDADPFKPRLSFERSAEARRQHDVVLCACCDETQREARPVVRPPNGTGMNVERHGCHCERRTGGNGREIQIFDLDALGAHPTAQLIAFADGEGERRRKHKGVLRIPGFHAQRFVAGPLDGRIDCGNPTSGGPLALGSVKGGVIERSAGKGRNREKSAYDEARHN